VSVTAGLKAGDRVVTEGARWSTRSAEGGTTMFKWFIDSSLGNRLLIIIVMRWC
jgi:hypothetical protein